MWLLSSMLMLWAPVENTSLQLAEDATAFPVALSSVDQALPLSSMMRQIGAAVVQGRGQSAAAPAEIAVLLAEAVQSEHWYILCQLRCF